MSMLNNVVGYWAYIRGTYIWGGLYSGGLIFGWAYIRGGGLIFGKRCMSVSISVYVVGLYSGGGLILGGGAYHCLN
jgi:hypothetical protein